MRTEYRVNQEVSGRKLEQAYSISDQIVSSGKFPYIRHLILHGSVARAEAQENSDIDLCIVTKRGQGNISPIGIHLSILDFLYRKKLSEANEVNWVMVMSEDEYNNANSRTLNGRIVEMGIVLYSSPERNLRPLIQRCIGIPLDLLRRVSRNLQLLSWRNSII